MKKIFKQIILIILIIAYSSSYASAYILGDLTKIEKQHFQNGLDYYNCVFTSKSVGKQNEHFFEYVPNESLLPVVVNGSQIYGKRTLSQAANYVNKTDNAVMGMNADYFSFKTGIPMGHTIINGEIVTKDAQIMDAIGFYKNGTAIIGELGIKTVLNSKYGTVEIDNINKWCQPNMTSAYMLNDWFGTTTKTESNCYFVVLSVIGGNIRFGEDTLRLKVDTAYEFKGEINIPKDKYIIAMDVNTIDEESKNYFKSLMVGDEVTVSSYVNSGDNRFNTIYNAIGSIGGRLIKNGKIGSGFTAGANPRTAVGINSYGTVIFYTIDGRQNGYSYGVQLTTLAKRLQELGCVEALNLDGGGSTTIGANLGSGFSILNKPSDGKERACSNFIFLNFLSQPIIDNNDIAIGNDDVFFDIATSWAHDEIIVLHDRGIINGYYINDRLCYCPNDSITRAEFASLITKFCGGANVNYDACNYYSDSYEFSDWMKEPISFVSSHSIMNGRYDNKFDPNSYITREEAITALARININNTIVAATPFADDNSISEWAKSAVDYFRTKGIIKGDYNNNFNPQNLISKQEAAAILFRMLE